jgi:PKD repeat protein
MSVRLNTISNVNIYSALGSGFENLSFQGCTNDLNGSFQFTAQAGQTYYLQADGIAAAQLNMEQILPPANDNFADASLLTSLPFDDSVDISAASTETNEPTPSCAFNGLSNTVWYAFTANITGSISASNPAFSFIPGLAAYTGNSLAGLTEIGCQTNGIPVTFHANAGTTYYFQAGMESGSGPDSSMQFHVEVTPPVVADFSYGPSDPSAFDMITFYDFSSDPGQAGFQSFTWNFGDGTSTTTTESFANHQYAKDGDYTVQHSVTTVDGRSASTSQIVQVRTHDVAITKVAAPNSATSRQTKTITVSLRNSRYPETVTVDLYKSTAGGDVWIDSITLQVPVLSGNKTKTISFNYTFTLQDAKIGKVTFRAVATINGVNDAFPQDNTGISSPPTKVTK